MEKHSLWVIMLFFAAGAVAGLSWQYVKQNPARDQYVQNTEAPGHGLVGKATDVEDPFDVKISYTGKGFEPAEITSKRGTRVRFLNASKETVWPAAGIHPTHTLYPEKEKTDCLGSSFDACADLQPGEFFDFTFNYVGEWRYHDHLHPYQGGSITVE